MLNIFKLNTVEGIAKYKSLLSTLDTIDPYFLPDYIDIFCGGFENLICFSFVSESNNASIFMPGYLKPITIGEEKTDFFDFISPYGYTGPFFTAHITITDIHEFWESIDEWYLKNNVITEFIRFNLTGNYIEYSGIACLTMLNIKGKIIDEESQWLAFDHKVRKNFKKAIRENLSCIVFHGDIEHDEILEFYDIYIHTMKRTNADERFFYEFEEIERFIYNNQQYVAISTVYFEQMPVSSELLLISEDAIYSFLGGTGDKYFDKRPNDLLKVETLNWARTQGKKRYILGGGYGNEDGIYYFKKSFFPNDVVNYYTGRKILNMNIYENLINRVNINRESSGLPKLDINDASFFPLYNITS